MAAMEVKASMLYPSSIELTVHKPYDDLLKTYSTGFQT